MIPFDPNAPCRPNARFFTFPYTVEESEIVLLPIPWDVTTSYRAGAARGPQAIMAASAQMDFYDFDIPKAWEFRIATDCRPLESAQNNAVLRPVSERVIAASEAGLEADVSDLKQVNSACAALANEVSDRCRSYLREGRRFGIVGGDHSVPLGALLALSEVYSDFGVLHLDAHADLRESYEGFVYSHASIFYNALKIPQITSLVQVGIRDVCEEEMAFALSQEGRVLQFDDPAIKAAAFKGCTWHDQVRQILETLPQKVYVSLDIDVLQAAYAPHTGTPVPGGLSYDQVVYLLVQLYESGRRIIGFDLSEVAPGDHDEWDANVGARLLYKLALLSK